MDITQEINTVEWFFGYGGNHIGLKRVIPNLCLRAVCEIEEYAIENILAKMESGLLEAAPIWSNCKTFPTQPFVDRVDLFIASYPCQPFSSAGKRQGENDERHLWPSVYMWIRATRPLCVFLENVEGHVSMGLSTVISDLEEAGYETSWGIFSARECLDGNNETATHQRKRVFIMAHLKDNGLEVNNGSKIQCETSGRWTLQPWGIRSCDVREFEYTSDERLSAALAIEDKQDKCRGEEHCYPTTGDGTTILWPSRPGQPQHKWEPPRVVGTVPAKLANFCTRDAQQGGDPAQASGSSVSERRKSADAMPNRGSSVCGGDQGDESKAGDVANSNSSEQSEKRGDDGEVLEVSSEQWADKCSTISGGEGEFSGEEVLGNADSLQCTGSGELGDIQRSILPQDGWQETSDGLVASSEGMGNAERQTQPEVGGDANGSSIGLDLPTMSTISDSELVEIFDWMVKGESRVDELRLLGNGVFPSTAEKAFRTLFKELIERSI